MADFMTGMDPFLIFPEEVWDLILDQVEDSQDAWNLLKAFPQLDASAALQKKKRVWLFGLVIPHLLIQWKVSCWIKEKDLLNCRQVCRKWSSAVDGFLEGQPQLQAYHPESEGEGQLLPRRFHWNVKGHLGYRYLEDAFFGGTDLDITDDVSGTPGGPPEPPPRKFLRDMGAHPPERSPFLSRALSISIWDDEDDDEYVDLEGVYRTDFAKDLLSLHQKFGRHVWFYKVNFEWDTLGASRLIENIRYLPNLKLLHLVVDDEDDDTPPRPPPDEANVKKLLEQLGKGLPAWPFLETLLLENCPRQFSHFLISRFAAQIRRLDLTLALWKEEYSKLFPNLTEFNVMDYHNMYPDGKEMKNLLLSLEAPQLSKLQLHFYYVWDELVGSCPFVIEDEVFRWLKRFPKLKFLGLGTGCRALHLIEKGSLDPQKDMNSSLQFLAIRTSFEMNYNFLRCLPSLQHLELHVPSKPFVIDLSSDPVVKIREEIQTASMYQSNVWELLPKLRTVTLVVDKNYAMISESVSWAFNRERYEFERRLSNGPAVDRGGDDHALAPLRKDIIGFLQFLQDELDRKKRLSRERDRFWDSDDEEEDSELDDWDLNEEDNSEDEHEEDEESGKDEDDAEGDEDEEGREGEDDEDEEEEESSEDNDEDGEFAEDEDHADEYYDDTEEIEN